METATLLDNEKNSPMYEIFQPCCDDAISVIDYIEKKFVLFIGHKARVVNQQQRIKALQNHMKDACVNSKRGIVIGLLCIDWKMKWEPFSNRETTMEHFDKRGVSWHGAYILYYIWLEGKAVEQQIYLN